MNVKIKNQCMKVLKKYFWLIIINLEKRFLRKFYYNKLIRWFFKTFLRNVLRYLKFR